MQQEKLQKILLDIGLSPDEALIYLASLSIGPTTVLKLSRVAGIKRTTAYRIIDDLKKKGLMRIEFAGLKKIYSAEDPRRLDSVLKKREQEFGKLLPEFEALYNFKQTGSEVKYYEGLESVKSALNMVLEDTKPHDEYLVIADQQKWYEQDPSFFQDFMEKRAKLPLKIRMLLRDSELTRTHKKFEKNYNISIRILPKETNLNTDVCITPQHMMIQQLKNPVVALVVDNPSMIETQKELFEMLWKSLPEDGYPIS